MNKENFATELEIKARKELLKKLKQTQAHLHQQAQKKLNKRKEKIKAASEYESIEEAHNAYGYDLISEEEFNNIKTIFEKGENYVEHQISPQEAAETILNRIMENLIYEIKCFEFDLLPPEKQAKILQHKVNKNEKK